MSGETEFESVWLQRLTLALETFCTPGTAAFVMGDPDPGADDTAGGAVGWTDSMIMRLNEASGPDVTMAVMTACACRYPKEDLEEARSVWERTGDLDRVLDVLQTKFEDFLRGILRLSRKEVDFVVSRNMGLAGLREGDTIVATKIPKSGFLREYIAEADPAKRRAMYCHCPRIRDQIPGAELSPLYCYCGAGFYKALWEDILGTPVTVEVLESILDGGDVCRIAIHPPAHEGREGRKA